MTLNIKGRAFVQIDVNPLMDNSWEQLMEWFFFNTDVPMFSEYQNLQQMSW